MIREEIGAISTCYLLEARTEMVFGTRAGGPIGTRRASTREARGRVKWGEGRGFVFL